jgi:hypothetical protein
LTIKKPERTTIGPLYLIAERRDNIVDQLNFF